MAFTINNTLNSTSAAYQGTTIAANGTLVINDPLNAYASDPTLNADILSGNSTITFGSQVYAGQSASNLLALFSSRQYNADAGAALDNFTKTATAAGAQQLNFACRGAIFTIVTSAVSGTTPTLTAQLQYSYDGGTTWVSIPGAVTASITAATTATLQVYPGVVTTANQSISWTLPFRWRFNYTIGGTTPSFTIKMYASYVD